MAVSTVPGYPRIGKHRELKRALEGYWSGKKRAAELTAVAGELRAEHRAVQRAAGLDLIPVNDFSLYDQMLDASALLVPELAVDQGFALSTDKPFAELAEATAEDVNAKVALIGPVTYLLLSKRSGDLAGLLDRLLPVYEDVVARLAAGGASWIQFDESAFVLDRTAEEIALLPFAYERLAAVKGAAKLLVHTAYGHVGHAFPALAGLPVDGLGFDLVRGLRNLDLIEEHGYPADKWLAAGIVDGRNIWVNDLDASLNLLDRLRASAPAERLMISSSSTLLHTPYDARLETGLDAEIAPWLAFAEQKLAEIVTLTKGVNLGRSAIQDEISASAEILTRRSASTHRANPAVQERLAHLRNESVDRQRPFVERSNQQAKRLGLPLLPTTTIGSFPQTNEVRMAR